jgi:LDH2 family malate/lactate/ureidoglycolate dehydrogenase
VIDHRVELGTPTNTGQAMFVLRPDLFMPMGDALASISEHLDELRQSGSATGDPVRLPGDHAALVEEENRRLGVPIPAPLMSTLRSLATRLGVEAL